MNVNFISFKGLTTTFEASNVPFDTDLLIFITAIHLLVIMHIMLFNEMAM